MGRLEKIYYKRIELIQKILDPIKDEFQDYVYYKILSGEVEDLQKMLDVMGTDKKEEKKGEKNV